MRRLLLAFAALLAAVRPLAEPPQRSEAARVGIASAARAAAAIAESTMRKPSSTVGAMASPEPTRAHDPAPSRGPVYTALEDVRACLPLSGGRVLAASAGGLWLFDERDDVERVWTARDGLPGTRVTSLLEDGEQLFVGTEAGLAETTLHDASLTVDRTIASKPLFALARHDGALYAGSFGDGLLRLDGARFVRVPVRGARAENTSRVTAIAEHDGELIAGTPDAGVLRLQDGALTQLPIAASAGEAMRSVAALAEHDGRLWVGGLEGLVSFAGGRARRESSADVRALGLFDDALVAGTFGEGLLRHDGRRLAPEPVNAWVQAVGARGSVRCLGTRDGLLVDRGDGASFQPVHAPALPSNDIAAIAIENARVFVGTFDQGLAVLEGGRFRRVAEVDPKVNAIAVDKVIAGRVWIATARGLVRLDGERATRLGEADGLPSADVHALAALREGGVLAGTARGAALLTNDGVRPLVKERGVAPGAVWSVAEGPRDTLFVGTSRGLLVGAPGGDWQRLSMSTGHLRDDWITALAVRGDDVFAGTYNAGVEALHFGDDGEVSVRHLGGGYVNLAGVLVDGDTLYAATMKGLLSRPLDPDPAMAWSPVRQARLGDDVTAVARSGAELWIATRRGLLRTRR